MPQLNVARQGSGSCFLGGNLYIICGSNEEDGPLKSVEKLTVTGAVVGEAWQLIPAKNFARDFTPRGWPIVCELNSNEIAIMGGYNGSDLNDVFILYVSTEKCGKVAQGDQSFLFHSVKNASARVGENKVAALVEGKEGKPVLI